VLLTGIKKTMSKQPLVSIIMNCYNGEEFLKEALDSIQNQTYNNWELIFWDNQSTDNSKNIFKSYSDPRLKYHYAQEHHNLYSARNLAISVSKGDFIAFLDTDDTWISKKIEIQLPYFDDPKVVLVYGNYWIHDQKKSMLTKIYSKTLPAGNILRYLLKDYFVGLLTIIVRRDVYEHLDNHFDSRFGMIGDFDFVIRLAFKGYFAAVQQPIASYRWHGKNISILHQDKLINEMEAWYEEKSAKKEFSSINELLNLKNNITYLKGKNCIEGSDYFSAIKYFVLLPFSYSKLKLLVLIIFPKHFVNYFTLLKR